MSATLSILNNLSLPILGNTMVAKQGAAASDFNEAFDITVTGQVKRIDSTLATATSLTAYDASVDTPATFLYGFFVSDQICYVQMIGSATHAIVKVAANTPFVIPGYGQILGAGSTTAISAEPTTTAIAKIVLRNDSGSTMNFTLVIVK